MTEIPVFGDPETITVADLQVGDFVVRILPHLNVRGLEVNSGIESITAAGHFGWEVHHGKGRGHFRQGVTSRVIHFLDRSIAAPDVPVTHEVIVRRPVR